MSACKSDLKNQNKTPAVFVAGDVQVYEKAKGTAYDDFNLSLDSQIKSFLVEIGEKNYKHHKADRLKKAIMFVPKHHPFNVFHFTYKNPSDGYLAIVFYTDQKVGNKKLWIIKSLAKNTSPVFSNTLTAAFNKITEERH